MQAPKLPSFFKTSRHRQFDFKTRYYNAEKEDLDNRVKLAQTNRHSFKFSNNWQNNKRSNSINQSNKRVILIVIVLLIVSFILLKF